MKNQKFNVYINGEYVCSTTQAPNAKAVKDKILKDGFVRVYGLTKNGFGWLVKTIKKDDKIKVVREG